MPGNKTATEQRTKEEKMKIVIILTTLMSLSAAVAFGDNPQEIYTTVSGAQYKFYKDVPLEMQPAYVDEQGLIWGANLLLPNSPYPVMTSQDAGMNLCAKFKLADGRSGRLPTKNEAIGLLQAMSADPSKIIYGRHEISISNPTYNKSKPALPGLEKLGGSESYLTSSIGPGGCSYVKHWGGRILCIGGPTSTWYIRCVIDLK